MKHKGLVSLTLALALAIPLGACVNLAEPEDSATSEVAGEVQETTGTETQETNEGTAETTEGTDEDSEAVADKTTEAKPVEISADQVSVKWDDSRVHTSTSLGNYDLITTYAVEGYEDVPFVKASEFLKIAVNDRIVPTYADGVLRLQVNDTEAVIDAKAATIHFDNTERFASAGPVDASVLPMSERDIITPSVKHASTQTDNKPITINLADYHMPVIVFEDDLLLPFLALQNTFGATSAQNSLAYNGHDYYNVTEILSYAMKENNMSMTGTPYADALYSGPFSEKTRMTEAYATYGYNATCLLLDLCYGHKQEKNITTFDEYFERIGAKESLSSTDPNSVRIAEMLLFYYLFDSGHDASMPLVSVFKDDESVSATDTETVLDDVKDSEEGGSLFGKGEELDAESQGLVDAFMGALIEKGLKIPELVPTMVWMSYMGATKPADYGTQRLDYAGDTAVIYFEQFLSDESRNPSYYLKPISAEDEEKSNFAFFYNCFEDIKKHDEVDNVVINLSNNGGGSSSGLLSILGFLSDDGEVNFTNLDTLTGSYREECFHVDTNLDGVADDSDGFGGQYDFYIMTSGQSYSCGTALPYYAQRDGLAKIIGSRPGGGDCCVWNFNDALGFVGSFSGMLKLGTEGSNGFVSDESAVTLDYDMMPTILDVDNVPWFDAEGIAEAVHDYESGKKEADYGDASRLDKLPSILEDLLQGLE